MRGGVGESLKGVRGELSGWDDVEEELEDAGDEVSSCEEKSAAVALPRHSLNFFKLYPRRGAGANWLSAGRFFEIGRRAGIKT